MWGVGSEPGHRAQERWIIHGYARDEVTRLKIAARDRQGPHARTGGAAQADNWPELMEHEEFAICVLQNEQFFICVLQLGSNQFWGLGKVSSMNDVFDFNDLLLCALDKCTSKASPPLPASHSLITLAGVFSVLTQNESSFSAPLRAPPPRLS